MKTLVINLSPRRNGTSSMLCEYFRKKLGNEPVANTTETIYSDNNIEIISLYSHLKDMQSMMESMMEAINNADKLVFVGPCYVDSYPAETISLLEHLADNSEVLHGQKIYGFIQGGMPYIHTHISGLYLLQNFAESQKLCWMGGFVMGGGAALNGQSIEHVIGAKVMVPAIDQFIENIRLGRESIPSLYEKANVKIPFFIAVMLSCYMGKMIRGKYKKMGIDYNIKNPYLK